MQIKRYTLASLLLIGLIVAYIFTYVTQETIGLEFFGIVLPTMPIAFWVATALLLLYVASVLHMLFYAMLENIRLRKYDKDFENIIDAIADSYLSKDDRRHVYKTPRYNLLGTIIDHTTLSPTQELKATTDNKKLDAVITLIEKINDGEVVDLKKYALKIDNPIVIKNERNRYAKGDITAGNILKNEENYSSVLVKEVYSEYIKGCALSTIENHKNLLDKETIYTVLDRVNVGEHSLSISNESLISLLSTLDLDAKDFIKVSSVLSAGMLPENRMKLFESLSEDNELALEARLYTLFDLEMNSLGNEILRNSQNDEYLRFKAYSELKESGKNFSINLFI
ncbi:hypothetical protein [Sulfurimonas sp.]|uniref:hypothetical protein n=1 Tax=Sulfurimonas sp. TaxID=2022749 RepID=UPI002B465C7E|nr:hypothetical protein [Sulfurimonas sp.]